MDMTGKTVISPKFDHVREFSEGLAPAAESRDGPFIYGYINTAGKMVIKARFSDAAPFSEGLGRVYVRNKAGYIDKNGAFVIPPVFKDAGSFERGLARVTTAAG